MFLHTAKDLQDPQANLTHRWLRHQNWKLIVPTAPNEPPELFDLLSDPQERTNLAAQHPDRVKTLQAKLDTWYPANP
jgi:uncharacterized sulfatase